MTYDERNPNDRNPKQLDLEPVGSRWHLGAGIGVVCGPAFLTMNAVELRFRTGLPNFVPYATKFGRP